MSREPSARVEAAALALSGAGDAEAGIDVDAGGAAARVNPVMLCHPWAVLHRTCPDRDLSRGQEQASTMGGMPEDGSLAAALPCPVISPMGYRRGERQQYGFAIASASSESRASARPRDGFGVRLGGRLTPYII